MLGPLSWALIIIAGNQLFDSVLFSSFLFWEDYYMIEVEWEG
jgi:hypothetical protein